MPKEQKVIHGIPDPGDILTESVTPRSEIPDPPPQPQQPAPESKDGGGKK